MIKFLLSDKISEDTTVWRYFDLPSFLFLLINKKLVFRRMDQFADKLEGTMPESTRKEFEESFKRILSPDEASDRAYTEAELIELYKMWCYVNSWTINESENYAFWKLYAKNEGIAIKTTIKKLTDAIIYDPEVVKNKQPITVKDANYEKPGIENVNQDTIYSTKYSAYSYESELRLFFRNQRDFKKNREQSIYCGFNDEEVKYLEVDLTELVDEMIISPFTEVWYREMIISLLEKKFGLLNLNIRDSGITEKS